MQKDWKDIIMSKDKKMENKRKEYLAVYGEVIKTKRIRKGFEQKELGESIGVSDTTISRYENGKIEIPASVLPVICRTCDFRMKDFSDKIDQVIILDNKEEIINNAQKSNLHKESQEKDNQIFESAYALSVEEEGNMWECANWMINNFADTDEDRNELSYIMLDLMTQEKKTTKKQLHRLYEYYRLLRSKEE